MNCIDRIYIIHLERRQDRHAHMSMELEKLGVPTEKVEWIDAVDLPQRPHLGATLSHIKAVETFLNSDLSCCLICEDDFTPKNPETFWDSIARVTTPFDILMLSHNILESEPTDHEGLVRVKRSFTASGYLLTRAFAPRLQENLVEGLERAVKEEGETGRKTHRYCLDVHWEQLMKEEGVRWLAIHPAIGAQCPSYSDIEGHMVNHGV